MSTDQEYWDACLIRTWRQSGTVMDAIRMFQSITKKNFVEECPNLKRVPKLGYPWNTGIKPFVDQYLSKISKRLWDQTPEKDILLLQKLKASTYDTENDTSMDDRNLRKEMNALTVNRKKVEYQITKYSKRNRATDWNVHQGPR
jgi:hypothetical protein